MLKTFRREVCHPQFLNLSSMKHLFSFTLITIMFAGVLACTKSDTKHSTPQSNALTADGNDRVLLLDPTLANTAMQRWQAVRGLMVNTFKGIDAPQDTAFIAKGFHIPISDLRKILNNIGDDSQLFAMLAIQYDSTKTPPAPYISLVFQAPDTTKGRIIRFYDFTRPCPSDCPTQSR